MTREEAKRKAIEWRERKWHAQDTRCGICGTVARLVPIESCVVRMNICLHCATRRMQVSKDRR